MANINFHQTFKPEKQYLSSILGVADESKEISIEELSSLTGIPNGKSSGKVEPHIFYSKYMGLITAQKNNGKYIIERTSIGREVYLEDPGLQENLTLLLCHGMISRELDGADIWNTALRKVMPLYKQGITRTQLVKELDMYYPGKITSKNIGPFINSYQDFFSTINIMNIDDSLIQMNRTNIYKDYVYLYALILTEYWNEKYPDQDEITSAQLNELKYKEIMGWNDTDEYQVLELMSDKELFRINRQLVPYTILRLTSEDYLINKLYSELC